MKNRFEHTITQGDHAGHTKVVLDKRAGRIDLFTSRDPWQVSEDRALQALLNEMKREDELHELDLEEPPDSERGRRARRREAEKRATLVHSSEVSALDRVTSKIKSFGQAVAEIAAGIIDHERR